MCVCKRCWSVCVSDPSNHTITGGQQQRVNLARAVYRALMGEADLVLMDDVLSAVDSHVGEHIFRDCISDSGALAGTTRVLVTHQVALTLPQADQVVIMGKDGTILEQGPRAMLQVRTVCFCFIHVYIYV